MDDLGKLRIVEGECSKVLATLNPSFSLVYIDPPFNTGKAQSRGEISYEDSFEDYLGFLVPLLKEARRLLTPTGSFFIHVDPRESHYLKVELDKIFGRDCFQNEIIWAYDYGGRSKKKWSSKHDVIFWYTKDPKEYTFNYDDIDRIPYMAPGLVGPEKAAKGKTPTDVWWHTIVHTNGKEKTGYPCLRPGSDVLTESGWRSIESVLIGDKVLAANGEFCEVFDVSSHLCGDDLFRLSVGEEFMDATQNHPFLIWREGAVAWVNAGGVKVGDYMMTPLLSDKGLTTLKPCEEQKEQEESSRKGTSKYEKGENVNWLMSLYGKQQTDPSHPDFNCTTGTGILRTTSFPISNLSTHLHTSGFTQVANSEMEFGGSLVKRAGSSNLQPKNFGIFAGDILTERFVESASSRKSSRSVEFVLRRVNHVDTVPYCGPVWNLSVMDSPTFQTRVGMSHNTQKPLGILKRIVRVHSQPGDNLLDFFAGSGSFGEAALSLGRNVVLVDNNPQAIEVMERRLGDL